MPLYDYRCLACGREVEVMHGIHDGGPQACEACGGAMRKALSPPAIHFKGSGWAKKDAATTNKTKTTPAAKTEPGSSSDETKPSSGDKAASDASSSASSESKTATTASNKND